MIFVSWLKQHWCSVYHCKLWCRNRGRREVQLMEGRILTLEIRPEASLLEDQYVSKNIYGRVGRWGWEVCKSSKRNGSGKGVEGRGIKGCIMGYEKALIWILPIHPSIIGVDTITELEVPREGRWEYFGLFGGITNVVSPSILFYNLDIWYSLSRANITILLFSYYNLAFIIQATSFLTPLNIDRYREYWIFTNIVKIFELLISSTMAYQYLAKTPV